MPTTEIEICNNALALCGQGTHIDSFTEQSKEANACSRVYPRAVERCVDKYDWTFGRKDEVIKEDQLLKDVASPPFQYTYNLPADCLRVLYLNCTDPNLQYARTANPYGSIPYQYRNYGGKRVLVTDAKAPFVLQYQALVTDVSIFPPTLIEAIEYIAGGLLAVDLMGGVSGAQLGLQLEKTGYQLLQQAHSLDTYIGAETIPDESTVFRHGSFVTVRNGAITPYWDK